jgi:hypothetical protein
VAIIACMSKDTAAPAHAQNLELNYPAAKLNLPICLLVTCCSSYRIRSAASSCCDLLHPTDSRSATSHHVFFFLFAIHVLLQFISDPERGVFVLCKTSNPSSSEVQTLRIEGGNGRAVYEQVKIVV